LVFQRSSPAASSKRYRAHRRICGLINSSGKHLLALINDILDLAKIEAGRWQLQEADLQLHHIAEDALQLVKWRAQGSNAVLENTVNPELETLYADERASSRYCSIFCPTR